MTPPTVTSTGFKAPEISALINPKVVAWHAEEAAFLWTQRDHAVHAPHFQLKHLDRVDQRLAGHLEGLRVNGPAAWQAAQAQLEDCDVGTVFTAAYLAFQSEDPPKMHDALQLGLSAPAFRRPLVAALGWLNFSRLRQPLAQLAQSSQPAHQQVALAVGRVHRAALAPGWLRECLLSVDAPLRAEALRVAGELQQRDVLELVRDAALATTNAALECQFWAARSLALLGNPSALPAALAGALQMGHLVRPAIQIAMRWGESGWARDIVRWLAGSSSTLRVALQAAGALGDPVHVPWLLEHMAHPQHARVAGEAFSALTGVDLEYLGLKQDPPGHHSEHGDSDGGGSSGSDNIHPDDDVPWPHPQAAAAWWAREQSHFIAGQRYLGGQPVSVDAAVVVLRQGYQRQRHGAALELLRLKGAGGAILFATSASASQQRHQLVAL
jgi:uncharacterized protein (TIGR02270 family)